MSKIGLYPAITEVFFTALRGQRRSVRPSRAISNYPRLSRHRPSIRGIFAEIEGGRPRRSCAMITMMIGSVSSSGMGALLLLLPCLSLRKPINPLHEIQISVDGRVPPDR